MDKRSSRDSLKKISVSQLEQKNESLNESLRAFLNERQGTWAAFQSLADEPQIQKSVQAATHIEWVYPRCEGQTLSFYSTKNGFEVGTFGVLEPQTTTPAVALSSVDGVLVPALAYNKRGQRLGRGKGYYDRALCNYQGTKVGVIFSDYITDGFPVEAHDIHVDYIVTDKEILEVRKWE